MSFTTPVISLSHLSTSSLKFAPKLTIAFFVVSTASRPSFILPTISALAAFSSPTFSACTYHQRPPATSRISSTIPATTPPTTSPRFMCFSSASSTGARSVSPSSTAMASSPSTPGSCTFGFLPLMRTRGPEPLADVEAGPAFAR